MAVNHRVRGSNPCWGAKQKSLSGFRTGFYNQGAFMSFWVYILQSETSARYYCGQTDDLTRRISQHNNPGYHGSRTTKVFKGPWKLIWSEKMTSRGDAVVIERKIKKRGIRRYLEDLKSVESRLERD